MRIAHFAFESLIPTDVAANGFSDAAHATPRPEIEVITPPPPSFSEEELENIKDYFSTIVETFKNGKTLTEPLHLFGEKEIQPNSTVVYKKPMLVLINELDFSCGDFFPAMIQDNKLGKLFGKKTAGAGGYVLFHPYSSSFGVAGFSLTGSIGYRFDGSPIENLGVTPDIPYELTVKDLQSNYQDYIHAVNTEVNKLLKK